MAGALGAPLMSLTTRLFINTNITCDHAFTFHPEEASLSLGAHCSATDLPHNLWQCKHYWFSYIRRNQIRDPGHSTAFIGCGEEGDRTPMRPGAFDLSPTT